MIHPLLIELRVGGRAPVSRSSSKDSIYWIHTVTDMSYNSSNHILVFQVSFMNYSLIKYMMFSLVEVVCVWLDI